MARSLDAQYGALLVDPCNAGINVSMYPGQGSNQFARFEANGGLPGNPASVYQVVAYHPVFGCWVFSETVPLATPNVATGFVSYGGATAGQSFFSTVVGSVRATAGCIELMYQGTELNRSGIVYAGIVDGGTIWQNIDGAAGGGGVSTTFQNYVGMLTHSERTPRDKMGLNFVPSAGDETFVSPFGYTAANINLLSVNFSKVKFMVLAMTLPGLATNAISIKTLAVIEFNYKASAGVAANTGAPSDGGYTRVLRALYDKDPSWYVNTFRKIGRAIMAGTTGYVTGGIAGAIVGAGSSLMAPRISSAKRT